MKVKKFWHLKWLPEDGEMRLFVVDGNEDIVLSIDCFLEGDTNEIEKDYWMFQQLQEICNEHNKTHLSKEEPK